MPCHDGRADATFFANQNVSEMRDRIDMLTALLCGLSKYMHIKYPIDPDILWDMHRKGIELNPFLVWVSSHYYTDRINLGKKNGLGDYERRSKRESIEGLVMILLKEGKLLKKND